MKKPERTPQRTAEEIKKVLEHCSETGMACHRCSYEIRCLMVLRGKPIMQDALALIQQIESELEAVRRERDALYVDLANRQDACDVCVHGADCKNDCYALFGQSRCGYGWRGVCPENTEVQPNE